VDIEDGVGQGGFELDTAADGVRVEILSGAGTVLDTLELGAQSAGLHGFDWVAGSHADTENLRFRVTATSGSVAKSATALMRDSVDAVTTSGSGFRLELTHSGGTAYSAVRAFN
jgi:flagellar basal-body rod modification protein FlgD